MPSDEKRSSSASSKVKSSDTSSKVKGENSSGASSKVKREKSSGVTKSSGASSKVKREKSSGVTKSSGASSEVKGEKSSGDTKSSGASSKVKGKKSSGVTKSSAALSKVKLSDTSSKVQGEKSSDTSSKISEDESSDEESISDCMIEELSVSPQEVKKNIQFYNDLKDPKSAENVIILALAAKIEKARTKGATRKDGDKLLKLKEDLFMTLAKSMFWLYKQEFLETVNNNIDNYPFPLTNGMSPCCQLLMYRPHIYGVCLRKIEISNKKSRNGPKWFFAKIGLTQTSSDKESRAEEVMGQIKKSYKNAGKKIADDDVGIMFCVPIAYTNPNLFRATEETVRRKIGKKVDKRIAKEYNLPIPTEWVYARKEKVDIISNSYEKGFNINEYEEVIRDTSDFNDLGPVGAMPDPKNIEYTTINSSNLKSDK